MLNLSEVPSGRGYSRCRNALIGSVMLIWVSGEAGQERPPAPTNLNHSGSIGLPRCLEG